MLKRTLLRKFSSKTNGVNGKFDRQKAQAISRELRQNFSVYQTTNLKSIGTKEFSAQIHSRLGAIDAETEEYSEEDLDRQRDLSIKFHWGHDHDFGEFKLEGRMQDRHVTLFANFCTLFPISLSNFKSKKVFDIGCWTGGTTLQLAALGSKVFAIEEVKKYANMASFLAKCFGLQDKITVSPKSIYAFNSEEFFDRFDIVHFPGVLYHVSDPLIALRILFNSLKVGGTLLIESAGINVKEPYCRFDGSMVTHPGGTREQLNRGGWNWFKPSPSALSRMMLEAGFDKIETVWHNDRIYGYGKKISQMSICRAGLSVPNIK